MPTITEGNLTFSFPACLDCREIRSTFVLHPGVPACPQGESGRHLGGRTDYLLLADRDQGFSPGSPEPTLLTLRIKSLRKVRDTLAGLATARVRAIGRDQAVAHAGMTCGDLRIVLHMENPPLTSALFTQAISPANVQAELKRLIRAIDSHLQVVDIQTSAHLPWTVQ